MRGEVLFEKMTGISEEYITEAALVPAVGASPAKKPENRYAALSRVLNSGWGVACICLLLAIATVVSILHWGLPGASVNPFPPAVDPNAPRYVYSMGSLHSFSHGESVDRPVERGEDIYLTVSVQNNGPAFQIRDSEWAQLSAVCVLQGDDSVTLEWRYSPRDGGNQPYWVQTGATETLGFVLTIPENATPGVYDLVLSYDGVKQVFGGALTVGEIAETYPPAKEEHLFSFGFKTPNMQSKLPKDFPIDVHVTNEGEPFTYEGDPADFSPNSAILYHMESGYEIKGYGTESGRPPKPCNVYFGQMGVETYTFPIPADAPEGVYGIKLTYRRASESLPNVLIVNDGKVGTYVDRFTFGYEKPDDAYPGDTVSFFTQVANEWDAFTYEGSSSDFAPAATLIHRQTQYRLDGTFDTATDFGTHTVEHWALGNATQVFMIPADAPVGDYDLVLSYGGYSQTFERVLTLLDPIYKDLDYPPVSDDHFFTFGIEAVDGFAIPGDRIDVTAWVVNQGEPFSFMGDPYTYAPTIILYHMDSDYVIQGHEAPTGVEPRPCNVLTGQKGSGTYTFFIPDDAPTGEYGIKLSYHGLESSFDSRLTVAVP